MRNPTDEYIIRQQNLANTPRARENLRALFAISDLQRARRNGAPTDCALNNAKSCILRLRAQQHHLDAAFLADLLADVLSEPAPTVTTIPPPSDTQTQCPSSG